MEGDNKEKVVHRNLLLPLFSDPLDQTNEPDNKSLVDQKETMSTQVAIAQVTNMFQRGLDYVTDLFWKHWDLLGPARLDL